MLEKQLEGEQISIGGKISGHSNYTFKTSRRCTCSNSDFWCPPSLHFLIWISFSKHFPKYMHEYRHLIDIQHPWLHRKTEICTTGVVSYLMCTSQYGSQPPLRPILPSSISSSEPQTNDPSQASASVPALFDKCPFSRPSNFRLVTASPMA